MNPTAFQRFQNDLRAAVTAGVPIEIGSKDSVAGNDRLTIAKLDAWELAVGPRIANGSLSEAMGSVAELPIRYRAALRVFDETDSMLAVLDGLTVRRCAREQVKRALRLTFIYLLLLLLVAFAGLLLFTTSVAPMVDAMRADMLLPAAINAPDRFDPMPWIPWLVKILGGSLVVALILMLAGGGTKLAMWLGGNHYVRCRVSAMTLRVVQMLVSEGVAIEDAVSVGHDLNGADASVRHEIQAVLKNPNAAQDLNTIANFWTMAGNDRLAYLKLTTPVAMVSTIGGGIALLYCVAVFWPIVSVLKDLATAGT